MQFDQLDDHQVMPSNPVFLEEITDAAWREVSENYGLPDEARPLINEALHLYRAWHSQAERLKTPATTRRDLQMLANTLGRAIEQLKVVEANPRAKVILNNAWKKASANVAYDHTAAGHAIEKWAGQLDEMRTTIVRAGASVAGGARGAWEQSRVLAMFILQLDQVLFKFTGKHVSRSHKRHSELDYVVAICKIADPEITPSSIGEAIKTIQSGGEIKSKKAG